MSLIPFFFPAGGEYVVVLGLVRVAELLHCSIFFIWFMFVNV